MLVTGNNNNSKKDSSHWEDTENQDNSNQGNSIEAKRQIKGIFDPTSIIESLVGLPKKKEHTQIHSKETKKSPSIRQEMVIFSRQSTESDNHSPAELRTETEETLQVLKEEMEMLEDAQVSLGSEISGIKSVEIPQEKGIYYLRYVQWLITVIRQLRMKIEDAHAWLNEFNSREKKRLGYKQKAKKHGTAFTLSGERFAATHAG